MWSNDVEVFELGIVQLKFLNCSSRVRSSKAPDLPYKDGYIYLPDNKYLTFMYVLVSDCQQVVDAFVAAGEFAAALNPEDKLRLITDKFGVRPCALFEKAESASITLASTFHIGESYVLFTFHFRSGFPNGIEDVKEFNDTFSASLFG